MVSLSPPLPAWGAADAGTWLGMTHTGLKKGAIPTRDSPYLLSYLPYLAPRALQTLSVHYSVTQTKEEMRYQWVVSALAPARQVKGILVAAVLGKSTSGVLRTASVPRVRLGHRRWHPRTPTPGTLLCVSVGRGA